MYVWYGVASVCSLFVLTEGMCAWCVCGGHEYMWGGVCVWSMSECLCVLKLLFFVTTKVGQYSSCQCFKTSA